MRGVQRQEISGFVDWMQQSIGQAQRLIGTGRARLLLRCPSPLLDLLRTSLTSAKGHSELIGRQRPSVRDLGYPVAVTLGAVDVLVLTALKEELDALLQVSALREPWVVYDGDPSLHVGVLEGRAGPIRVAAAWATKMGGVATATLATRLIESVKPACLAMCGVCAGHPEDTNLGDVVIGERLFQHDEGKRGDGFQGDLWVDALRDDWLRIAQEMAGPATQFDIYTTPVGDDWKWWFLAHLAAGRDPLKSAGLRRYIPDERRSECLHALRTDHLVTLNGKTFALAKAGRTTLEEHQVIRGTRVTSHPFHVLVGPMGSGNAVHAGGDIWKRLANGGMRKVLAVEMEAAAVGRVAHERGLRFAVAKGVMDHAGPDKTDRFKTFAARAAAEVLFRFLCKVVKPDRRTSEVDALERAWNTRPPPLDPPDRRFDTDEYVAALGRRTATATALLPRVVHDRGRNTTIEISCDTGAPPFTLTHGDVHLLQGWSGRGKTSVLTMLAHQALHARPRRLPIFVDMTRQPQPLRERILTALRRELCETVFAGVREHFLFAKFPCRAIVHYYPDPQFRFPPSFCVARYWDPIESWADAATVVHLGSEPSHEEFEVLAAAQRKFCADRGRRHVEFKVHHTSDSGMWSAWQPLVTKAVHEFLRADIDRLIAMVPDPYR